jgi:hypothetical protein
MVTATHHGSLAAAAPSPPTRWWRQHASMSPDSPVHAQRVTPSPLVLEVKTSPHLGHWLTGGSRAAASALGAVTVQSARQAWRAILGWAGHIGRGLGHPPAGRLGLLAHERGRPPALERCGFRPDRANYCSSFFKFWNPLILSIFWELVPNSKNCRNLHTIQINIK